MISQSSPVRSTWSCRVSSSWPLVGRVGQLGSDDIAVRRDGVHADVPDGPPEPDVAVVAPGLRLGFLTQHLQALRVSPGSRA